MECNNQWEYKIQFINLMNYAFELSWRSTVLAARKGCKGCLSALPNTAANMAPDSRAPVCNHRERTRLRRHRRSRVEEWEELAGRRWNCRQESRRGSGWSSRSPRLWGAGIGRSMRPCAAPSPCWSWNRWRTRRWPERSARFRATSSLCRLLVQACTGRPPAWSTKCLQSKPRKVGLLSMGTHTAPVPIYRSTHRSWSPISRPPPAADKPAVPVPRRTRRTRTDWVWNPRMSSLRAACIFSPP